jgi:hypothetical protein
MRAHGPRRKIVGEFLHSDGDLYAILECGHAVKGNYDSDGMPMSKGRMCMHCASKIYYGGHEILRHAPRFGFLADPETAIKEGRNIALWAGIASPQFSDFNEKHLDGT